MFTTTVDSMPQFLAALDMIEDGARFHVYRGQSVQRNLIPGIGRLSLGVQTANAERELLNQLRLMGASQLPSGSLSLLDLMVLGQHFGLKTRLLDWSANPLVALYFACTSGVPEQDAYVYILWAQHLIVADPYDQNPFAYTDITVIQPRLNNERVLAQDGWFTVHPFSLLQDGFISIEQGVKEEWVDELHIPAMAKPEIMRGLTRLGITSRSMFPDLAGLCAFLKGHHLPPRQLRDSSTFVV